jgi:DNA-binding transcriptional MerR regulator
MQTHYTPTAAAGIVGISVSSLRNWCAQFADHLSPEAHPPTGQERKLSAQDLAILQRIKDLRAQGMETAAIKATLQTEDTTALQPYIDVAPQPPTAPAVTAVAPIEQPATEALQIAFTTITDRITGIEQRIENASRITLFAMGVLTGVLLVVAALLLLYTGAWMAR